MRRFLTPPRSIRLSLILAILAAVICLTALILARRSASTLGPTPMDVRGQVIEVLPNGGCRFTYEDGRTEDTATPCYPDASPLTESPAP